MNFIKIGSHAINVDRVADIWEEHDEAGAQSGRVLVYCGDHRIDLTGGDAALMLRFRDEVARPYPAPASPPARGRKVRVTGGSSGVDPEAKGSR
jgi:hypothetical protein